MDLLEMLGGNLEGKVALVALFFMWKHVVKMHEACEADRKELRNLLENKNEKD